MDTYRRHRSIGAGAITRLRECASRDLKCRSDYDLGNLLDSAVHEAMADDARVELVLDEGIMSKVVDISHVLDANARALVRMATTGEHVLTVLTPEQADANRAGGRWKKPDDKPTALAKLGDKLKLPPLAAPAVEEWMLRYTQAGKPQYEVVPKHEVATRIEALIAQGVDANAIKPYQPVPFKTRTVVEVGE
jgi:hypothetical protein